MCVTKNLNHYTSARVFFFLFLFFPVSHFYWLAFVLLGRGERGITMSKGGGLHHHLLDRGSLSLSLSSSWKTPKKGKKKRASSSSGCRLLLFSSWLENEINPLRWIIIEIYRWPMLYRRPLLLSTYIYTRLRCLCVCYVRPCHKR